MFTSGDQRYTASQLGQLAGVSERTVRYYVREKLIDPPTGRGRGSHFDNRHLGQLRRVRVLQERGLEHADIRAYRKSIEDALTERGLPIEETEHAWGNFSAQSGEFHSIVSGVKSVPTAELVTRIRVADGIYLLIDHPVRLPPPEKLSAAVEAVRAAFSVCADKDRDEA